MIDPYIRLWEIVNSYKIQVRYMTNKDYTFHPKISPNLDVTGCKFTDLQKKTKPSREQRVGRMSWVALEPEPVPPVAHFLPNFLSGPNSALVVALLFILHPLSLCLLL